MNNAHSNKSYKAGEIIMKQGDKGSSAFIIEEGRVEIVLERPDGALVQVGTRGKGSIIGEMAIVDDSPRVATVKAIEDCELLEITKEDFSSRLHSTDPVIQMISQVILTRYRDMLKRAEILGDEPRYPPPELMEKKITEQSEAFESVRINNELQLAIQNNDLTLNYQPLVDLKSGNIIGAEALLRWTHKDLGFISPGIFIPIAERSGLILDVTKWVVKESARSMHAMQEKVNGIDDLYISINFSSYDFAQDDFVDHLMKTADEQNIKPNQLTLEITERILIQQPDKAKHVLEQCHDKGMKIALDDFGTGYSSLSYLHYFPIDILKIDQSFVQELEEDPRSYELVKSIIALGKNLDLSVIAEGVETEVQAKKLVEAGCDQGQGYFFAKPMPEKEFTDLIPNWTSPI